MANSAIFDTSIFVDVFRHGRHQDKIESFVGLIRTSAVVLAELWRGATNETEHAVLAGLRENHPVWTPSEGNWIDSALILKRMRKELGCSAGKLRELHFDVLIALTARSNSARVITSNARDFELIQGYRSFELEVW